MSAPVALNDGEISLFAVGATLLRKRWRIVRWGVAGGVLAALSVVTKPALYTASLSFVPQGGDPMRSGLASLAGQFGITAPTSTAGQSPEFYVGLLRSRELLGRIVRDTFTVAETGGKRVSYMELFKATPGPAQEELAVQALGRMVNPAVARNTGVVQVSIATRWPSVSLAIVTALLDGVNQYNLRTRQSQAGAERKFIESQMDARRSELRAAEDRLQEFLNRNRGPVEAPQLKFARDRLERDVAFQQQVFTTLTQSFEDVRIREVRDTPSITVFETPAVSALPDSRGRVKRTLLGVIMGAMVGAMLALVSEVMKRRRSLGDPEAEGFVAAFREARPAFLRSPRRRVDPDAV